MLCKTHFYTASGRRLCDWYFLFHYVFQWKFIPFVLHVCLLLFVQLINKDRRRVKIIKYFKGDFLYSPAWFNQSVSNTTWEFHRRVFTCFYSLRLLRRKLEGVLGSQFMVLCPTELSGCFIRLVQRNSGMLCEHRPRLVHFIIPTPSYRTFNTTDSKSGCCTRSVSHPNKLCKYDLNVIFHLLSGPNGRFEIRYPTKTLYREARKVFCANLRNIPHASRYLFGTLLWIMCISCVVVPRRWQWIALWRLVAGWYIPTFQRNLLS